MSLQALVFCADEKVVRVLRRVLSELEIGMELCPDAESAIHKLTRRRFEAVIVDCADPRTASRVLRSARSAPCNKRAVAVAIVGAQTDARQRSETWGPISFSISRFPRNAPKPVSAQCGP